MRSGREGEAHTGVGRRQSASFGGLVNRVHVQAKPPACCCRCCGAPARTTSSLYGVFHLSGGTASKAMENARPDSRLKRASRSSAPCSMRSLSGTATPSYGRIACATMGSSMALMALLMTRSWPPTAAMSAESGACGRGEGRGGGDGS